MAKKRREKVKAAEHGRRKAESRREAGEEVRERQENRRETQEDIREKSEDLRELAEEARRIAEEAREEAALARDEGRKHAVQSSQRIAELGEQIQFFKGLIENLQQSARSSRALATHSRQLVRKDKRSS